MEQPRKISLYGILTIFNTIILGVLVFFFFTQKSEGNSTFALINDGGKTLVELMATDEGGALVLRDANGVDRIRIQGGETAAVMLKNGKGELVTTMFTGHDETGAIGLGDAEGNVSALMKGGNDPSLGFFRSASYPSLSLGISDSIPHVLFYSPSREQLVLHGGATNSLLFIDAKGEVPLSLTKEGIKQRKEAVATDFVIPYKLKRNNKLISNVD